MSMARFNIIFRITARFRVGAILKLILRFSLGLRISSMDSFRVRVKTRVIFTRYLCLGLVLGSFP